jgi:phage terminase small subunit
MKLPKINRTVDGLTPRQKRFCEEYIKTYNATKAALEAGFSKNRPYELAYQQLQKPHVLKYIERLEEERANCADIDEVELIKDLKKIKNDPYEKTNDRLKAMELLGRYKGMDKMRVDNTVKIVCSINDTDSTNNA